VVCVSIFYRALKFCVSVKEGKSVYSCDQLSKNIFLKRRKETPDRMDISCEVEHSQGYPHRHAESHLIHGGSHIYLVSELGNKSNHFNNVWVLKSKVAFTSTCKLLSRTGLVCCTGVKLSFYPHHLFGI
jgi:hypothetical protein